MKTLLLLLMLMLLSACDNKSSLSDAAMSISPPRPLMDMVLVDSNGDALPAGLLRKHWSYVILADSNCDEVCQHYLNITSSAVSENNNDLSMQRLLVLGFSADKAFIEKLKADHPDLVIAMLTRPIWAIFTVNFLQVAQEMSGTPLFLVDPRGFLGTAYDDFVEARDLSDDLAVLSSSLKTD